MSDLFGGLTRTDGDTLAEHYRGAMADVVSSHATDQP